MNKFFEQRGLKQAAKAKKKKNVSYETHKTT